MTVQEQPRADASSAITRARPWLLALIVWNVFDIVLHVAVDQVELLRVSSNVVMIVVAAMALVKGPSVARLIPAAIAIFVALNVVFMATSGRVAPVMTILVVGSCVMAYLAYQRLRGAPTRN